MDISPEITEKLKKCELPPLPELTQRIIKLTQDIFTDPNDVAELVKMDMSLSTSVLKIANSAAFGASGQVSSIGEAISRIGITKMRDMVLSVSLVHEFKSLKGIDFKQFWKHCLTVALAAEVIEKHRGRKGGSSEYTYSAGLLHKVGILLLAQNFPELYQQVLDEIVNDEKDLWELEKSIIGVTHNEASHFIFDNWQFPDEVSKAALYYNDPVNASDDVKEIVNIVHLANFACLNQGVGVGIEKFPVSFDDEAFECIGLQVDDIPEIIEEVHNLKNDATKILKAVE